MFWLLLDLGAATTPHGDVHRAILAITKKMAQRPNSAGLHLRRGELHRIHRDWVNAERDYRRALKLDPSMQVARRALARMFLQAGRPTDAEREVRGFLIAAPGDADGWALLARALETLGHRADATDAWRRATTGTGGRRADLWLQRTRAVARSDAAAALRDLDVAAAGMGRPVVLDLEALALERSLSRFDDALTRVRRLASQARRKASWRLLEAEVLEQAGRTADANMVFREVDRQLREGLTRARRVPKDWHTRTASGLRRTHGTRGDTR
ncbi:MAG: tetratricopeptide repeat protein [Planctomycetes bacterium]|nr:tetratricopeptide repeat protein [Planctomycetota bacterium]